MWIENIFWKMIVWNRSKYILKFTYINKTIQNSKSDPEAAKTIQNSKSDPEAAWVKTQNRKNCSFFWISLPWRMIKEILINIQTKYSKVVWANKSSTAENHSNQICK